MEFYEIIEKAAAQIPSEYGTLREAVGSILPWILGLFALLTCFFGHTFHKVWNAFFFFCIGFSVPFFAANLILKPSDFWFNVLIIISAAVGVVCAYFSKNLFRVQLFITSFLLAFISVPEYFAFAGEAVGVIIGLAAAIAAAFLSLRYKYIVTIVTTAFSGASVLFSLLPEGAMPSALRSILALILGAAGLFVQCRVEKEELHETAEHLKKNKKKITDFKNRKNNTKDKFDNDEIMQKND